MEYDDLSLEARATFHAAARKFQRKVWSFVVPVRISRIVADRESTYNTGTGMLVRLSGRAFLLTAHHVFAELAASRSRGEETYFIVGNAALEPPNVVCEDKDNDIVLLEVSETKLGAINAEVYDPGARWPPRRVSTDDVVLLCGLPAYLRTESADSEILFGDFSVMQPVSSVSERQFVLHLNRDEWVSIGRAGLPGVDTHLGGISGAPVFVSDPGSFQLVGIVSEIGETIPLLYVKSLSHLPRSF